MPCLFEVGPSRSCHCHDVASVEGAGVERSLLDHTAIMSQFQFKGGCSSGLRNYSEIYTSPTPWKLSHETGLRTELPAPSKPVKKRIEHLRFKLCNIHRAHGLWAFFARRQAESKRKVSMK